MQVEVFRKHVAQNKTLWSSSVAQQVNGLSQAEVELTSTLRLKPGFECRTGKQFVLLCYIRNPESNEEKSYSFDYSYDSFTPVHNQEDVFRDLGHFVLDNSLRGFNATIFAYGQTGSGKSYSMMGSKTKRDGLIPRICIGLFENIRQNTDPNKTISVNASYLEIYNEQIRDLLVVPKKGEDKRRLKVRDNPKTGPYVEDLSEVTCASYDDIEKLLSDGDAMRTIAQTNMNATSSRSHSIFTIKVKTTTILYSKDGEPTATDTLARVVLVDLAGSEKQKDTGTTGQQFEEAKRINLSLTALGLVIANLAEAATKKGGGFVNFRDSVLTHLLQPSLVGNSKTAMVAALSPASVNYEETLSTLRWADNCKKIKTKAEINESPTTS
ncbi:putative Kinesin-related protein 1 [Paratrimastix pyriformis]|uniref:Kinesin-like protein n=1 Tax=Paratrimastix pyriformis TaxID=342808 RepID=A0ABQ8UK85_9EUKA|nr:putative Kinesin-related protein 1 [Paratrimastix pyriformis]